MAAVSRARDRGQLLLVTGLSIAVILVALVLLLNTVIYTENLATRGIDSGAGDAVEYRATVVGSVEELIERENERYGEGPTPNQSVRGGIETIDAALAERYLARGTIAAVQVDGITVDEGSPRIWQNESGSFTAGGDAEWTVAENATAIDRFDITVESIEPFNETADNERLRVVIEDSESDPWTLQINATEESTFEVQVDGSNTSTYENESLEIDLVDGTINNETVFDGISSAPTSADAIRFENGDTTTGTFELHVDGTPDERNLTEYDGGSEAGPYYAYPVESVDLRLYYETDDVRFSTEETIDPEGGS